MTATSFVIALVCGVTQAAQPFTGDWLSDGYGLCAHVDADSLTLYQVTAISSFPELRVTRDGPPDADGSVTFHGQNRAEVAILLPQPEPDRFALYLPGAASSVVFRRVEHAPEVVGRPVPDDPETTFEILWQTMAIHYPFFTLRGMDWNAARAKYRPLVTKSTKQEELFNVLRSMLEPLHDAHTSLRAPPLNLDYSGFDPGPRPLSDADQKRGLAIVQEKYLQDRLESGCNGRLKYALLDAKTGYLRIEGFGGYARTQDFEAFARALDETLDAAMKQFAKCEALVIDVRLNGGGSDVLGVMVASRLTDQPYVAFVKRARNDPENQDGWTAPQPTLAKPTGRPSFLGKVFLLTSRYSVSAAETFTMATMGRAPHVVRVGDRTQGVYSDVLGRRLPNGWFFGFPNEVFLTEKGEHFEKRGVPPDHEVPIFAAEDLAAGKDACLEKVFALLDEE